MKASGPQLGWAAINAFGLAGFLYFASHTWIEPDTQPLGEPFVWGVTALPIFTLFCLTNLLLGGFALHRRRRDWMLLIFATAIVWGAAFYFDGQHHGG